MSSSSHPSSTYRRRLSRIRHDNNGDVSIRRRRRFCSLVPITALTCLSIHESTSLIIPTQQHLSHTSSLTGFQYRSSSYQYKRRRREVSNTATDNDIRSIFQLYFAPPDSCNYDYDAHLVHSDRRYNMNIERYERQPMAKRRDYNIMIVPSSGGASLSSVRHSTSLYMAQSSESNNDGKNEDKKKKEKTSNSKNNKRKDGGSASISKGSNKQSKQQQQQRTRRKKNGKKKQQNRSKGKSKSNRSSKSTIKTSGENTSLKGFKSKQQPPVTSKEDDSKNSKPKEGADTEATLQKRVIQLESIVSNQMTEIQKLRREIDDLTKSTAVFANVVNILQEAGLRIDEDDNVALGTDDDETVKRPDTLSTSSNISSDQVPFQTIDDMEIFGIAPKSVTDAADAAGSSILSAILAGKHRMLVDVRDAELTRDPKLFVEFIELAILPVAAGLEGLDTSADENEYVTRNRVKIVFPTVKELMSYRRSMALAAPEVVSLSTLGFDPVDEKDNLIVVVAPSPDDMAGVTAMEKLMARTRRGYNEPGQSRLTQPVVVVNHHMVPINMDEFGKFTSVYHLRLLSVQYMTGDSAPDYVAKNKANKGGDMGENLEDTRVLPIEATKQEDPAKDVSEEGGKDIESSKTSEDDEALEAAMTHAHEIGVHQGVTRAMVIRAYPKPWHVFVDTSPDTDADFEVAATFDIEPTQEDVNYAIVECLEGSEREDEIVAQQMQAALESGQLNRVSDMLGISPTDIVAEDKTTASSTEDTAEVDTWVSFQEETKKDSSKDKDDNSPQQYNDWDDLYFFDDDDWFNEDSV